MRFVALFALAALSTSALAAPSSSAGLAPSETIVEADLYHPKILLLRHGEKKSDGSIGLNKVGKKRAKCLRKVLGRKGKHANVGLILAEHYLPNGKRKRPFLTVKALAEDLGLKVDTDCDVEDAKCVRKKIEKYVKSGGRGEVVICWKHSMLHVIAEELGAPPTLPYPDERFDIIWTLHRNRIVTKESEQCPGIDPPPKKGRKDPDLEVDVERSFDNDDGEDEFGGDEWELVEEESDQVEYGQQESYAQQLRFAHLD
ncbi:hypothetical protein JCM8547_000263 [Rhodosporidiobolus lusitaniae]